MRTSPTCDPSQQRNGDSPTAPAGPDPERTPALTAEEEAKLDKQRKSMAHARALRWKQGKKSGRQMWREKVERAMQWAAEHDPDLDTINRAKGLRKMLLELKAVKPDVFMRLLIPLLPSAPAISEAADGAEEGSDAAARKQLDEWLASMGTAPAGNGGAPCQPVAPGP
jgi:hypothetical protein